MKRSALFLLIVCCFYLAGCSKDAEINAFITEFDATTNDIVQKIDANPTSAGVDDAQKAFDAKKASLTAKWDAIKDAKGFQVSSETQAKLKDSVEKNMKALMDVATKNAMKMAMDKDASTKFQALIKNYQATFTPPTGSK
jgi:4-alpha-glucanotransferase